MKITEKTIIVKTAVLTVKEALTLNEYIESEIEQLYSDGHISRDFCENYYSNSEIENSSYDKKETLAESLNYTIREIDTTSFIYNIESEIKYEKDKKVVRKLTKDLELLKPIIEANFEEYEVK
jgi:hypothetical protein